MLIINIKVDAKAIKQKFGQIPDAITHGLTDAANKVFGESHKLLSGAGAKGITTGVAEGKKIKKQKWTRQKIGAGGYPVPVRTGHLRSKLYVIPPGATKEGVTVSKHQAIVRNSAEYADVIHSGKGKSARYGKRPYLTDAVAKIDITAIINKAISGAIK